MKNNRTGEYIGKGISTLGIWVGVGMVGAFDHTGIVAIVALCALFATACIW